MTIKDDSWTAVDPGIPGSPEARQEYKVTLNSSKSPIQFDGVIVQAGKKGNRIFGIYSLEGNIFTAPKTMNHGSRGSFCCREQP
jgi:hypothetical protein